MHKITLHDGDLSDSSRLIRFISLVQPDEIYNLIEQSHIQVLDVVVYFFDTIFAYLLERNISFCFQFSDGILMLGRVHDLKNRAITVLILAIVERLIAEYIFTGISDRKKEQD